MDRNGGVGEIRTLAAVTHSNDLANRPLQPLEYHSVCDWCASYRKICPQASDIRYNNRPMPPCQPKFSVSYMISLVFPCSTTYILIKNKNLISKK